ncbi:MAG: response regulator [Syntrophorhabdales bacterium]
MTSSHLPLRVLVVDNDEAVCTATAEMLESLGYRADCETDSRGALKVFTENPDKFALAIIEPILPDIMGLDLAIRLKAIRPDLPVFFYAGYADESLSRRIGADGLGKVALKPFRLNELAAAVRDRLPPGPVGQQVPGFVPELDPFSKVIPVCGCRDVQAPPFPPLAS